MKFPKFIELFIKLMSENSGHQPLGINNTGGNNYADKIKSIILLCVL